jgi:hypothetical protein
MSKRRDQGVDLATIGERLIGLAELGECAGGEPAWLEETFALLQCAFIELEKRRRGEYDPRRERALALARRMRAARRSGASVEEIAATFNRRKSTVYRLLNEVSRSLETVSVLNPSRSTTRTREGGS